MLLTTRTSRRMACTTRCYRGTRKIAGGCRGVAAHKMPSFPLASPVILIARTAPCLPPHAVGFLPLCRAPFPSQVGMLEGVLSQIPTASVSFLGMERNEDTLEPHAYYEKIAPTTAGSTVLLIDPMLATGGTAVASIDFLLREGDLVKLPVIDDCPRGRRALIDDEDKFRCTH